MDRVKNFFLLEPIQLSFSTLRDVPLNASQDVPLNAAEGDGQNAAQGDRILLKLTVRMLHNVPQAPKAQQTGLGVLQTAPQNADAQDGELEMNILVLICCQGLFALWAVLLFSVGEVFSQV